MSIVINYDKFKECNSDLLEAISFMKKANSEVSVWKKLYNESDVNLDFSLISLKKLKTSFDRLCDDYERTNRIIKKIIDNQDYFDNKLRGLSLGLNNRLDIDSEINYQNNDPEELNEINAYFEIFSDNFSDSYYGADQNATRKYTSSESERLLNILIYRYHFSNDDAFNVFEMIDTCGICTYAAAANGIFSYFNGKDDLFQEIFGFPMTVSVDGYTRLNSSELILDMYIYFNTNRLIEDETGNFINTGLFECENGNYYWTGKTETDGLFCLDVSTFLNNGYNNLNDYLQNKSSGKFKAFECNKMYNGLAVNNNEGDILEIFEEYTVYKGDGFSWIDTKTFEIYGTTNTKSSLTANKETLSDYIRNNLQNGNYLSLAYYGYDDSYVTLTEINGNLDTCSQSWNSGGHAVFITGCDEEGIYISSWGNKYKILYKDLVDSQFNITSWKIDMEESN